jgi:hypothetical protein
MIDFVLAKREGEVTAIECKWARADFETRNLDAFRQLYPDGRNFVVVGQGREVFQRRIGGHEIEICGVGELAVRLQSC